MNKFQLTFYSGLEKKSSEVKFKVYDNESAASQALSLYTEVTKPRDIKNGCVVELSRVVYSDGKPCGSKLMTRKNVSDRVFIEEKKIEVVKVEEKKIEVKKKTEKKNKKKT